MATPHRDIQSSPGTPAPAGVRGTLSAAIAAQPCALDQPVTLIGGRRDCPFALTHPDVSKVHCAIVNIGRAFLVIDLCSRMGTYVNEERVQTRALRPGDRLRVGSVDVTLTIEQDVAPTPAEYAALAQLAPPLSLTDANGTRTVTLNGATLGRRNGCTLSLDDPDISLVHAVVFQAGTALHVVDLGSRSGTHVNGAGVGLAPLQDGDELRVGRHVFEVGLIGAAPVGATEREQALDALLAQPPGVPDAAPAGVPAAGDLEGWFAALQQRVEQGRRELEGLRAEISEREAALAAQQQELAGREAALVAYDDELSTRETKVNQQAAEANRLKLAAAATQRKFEQECAELAAERDSLAAAQDEFAASVSDWETEKQQEQAANREQALVLEGRERMLVKREDELSRWQAELDQCGAQLEERQAAVVERENEVMLRAEQVEQLAVAVSAQQARMEQQASEISSQLEKVTERDAKIARVRAALKRASQVFSQSESDSDAEPTAMPAPLVDQPLFSVASDQTAPGEAAPARRGRLPVPRRDN